MTNSQAAAHNSWLVRYSPCAPEFQNLDEATPLISGNELLPLAENNLQTPPFPFYLNPPVYLYLGYLSDPPPLSFPPIIWNWRVCGILLQ